ncbi:MAG: nitroreductase family protein [Gracilibacteraceae bacterium]|jgi:nitroreductase|nr:nitroreductase family protein [Gracilibacteraceae bacterium]
MSNPTIAAIMSRYTCRDYSDKMPPADDLTTIAQAALSCPSGGGKLPWQIIVVKNKELMQAMDEEGLAVMAEKMPQRLEATKARGGLFCGAPCMIVVPMLPGGPNGSMFDCGIVVQTIAIAARSLGIDSMISGSSALAFQGPRGDDFKRRLGFAADAQVGLSVLLGYAKTPGRPHELCMDKISVIE